MPSSLGAQGAPELYFLLCVWLPRMAARTVKVRIRSRLGPDKHIFRSERWRQGCSKVIGPALTINMLQETIKTQVVLQGATTAVLESAATTQHLPS